MHNGKVRVFCCTPCLCRETIKSLRSRDLTGGFEFRAAVLQYAVKYGRPYLRKTYREMTGTEDRTARCLSVISARRPAYAPEEGSSRTGAAGEKRWRCGMLER